MTLSSHDVGGITSRDIELARRISAFAAELGARPTLRQTELEPGLDTAASEAKLGAFYAALLGGEVRTANPSTERSGAGVWPDGERGTALPEAVPPQRWHFDVWVPTTRARSGVEAVLDAGGRLVSDAEAPSFWVLEDADGNRSCICTPLDAGDRLMPTPWRDSRSRCWDD